jgi:hypothetical protein
MGPTTAHGSHNLRTRRRAFADGEPPALRVAAMRQRRDCRPQSPRGLWNQGGCRRTQPGSATRLLLRFSWTQWRRENPVDRILLAVEYIEHCLQFCHQRRIVPNPALSMLSTSPRSITRRTLPAAMACRISSLRIRSWGPNVRRPLSLISIVPKYRI